MPSEAVIHTWARSIVIVRDNTGFRPTEVRIGGELNGRTEILTGLSEGEHVVASGQFLIDSEASLSGVLTGLRQGPPPRSSDEHANHSSNENPPAPPAAQPTPEQPHLHNHNEEKETPR